MKVLFKSIAIGTSDKPERLSANRLALLMLGMLFLNGCRGVAPNTGRTATPTRSSQSASTLAPGANGSIESILLITRTATSEYFHLSYWSDGLRVKAFLGRPRADGRHPAIIHNRGGNQDYGALKGGEIVPLVEAGYVAVASQYRGNAGSEGREEFGGADVNDVLNLLPLLKQRPEVDPERIGMIGFSRGGMMTYLALKQETLAGRHDIKVAATVSGLTDLFMSSQERPRLVRRVLVPLIGARPEEAPDLYKARSATYWPELINAPLLILQGEADDRVSVAQARQLAEALKKVGKSVKIITYSGEGHGLPQHFRGYPETLTWFERYLGKPGEDHSFKTHRHAILTVQRWFRTVYQRE